MASTEGGWPFVPLVPVLALRGSTAPRPRFGRGFLVSLLHFTPLPFPRPSPPAQAVGSVWGLTQPQSPAWDVQIQPELIMTAQPISRAGLAHLGVQGQGALSWQPRTLKSSWPAGPSQELVLPGENPSGCPWAVQGQFPTPQGQFPIPCSGTIHPSGCALPCSGTIPHPFRDNPSLRDNSLLRLSPCPI